jgi:hypothetical protein
VIEGHIVSKGRCFVSSVISRHKGNKHVFESLGKGMFDCVPTVVWFKKNSSLWRCCAHRAPDYFSTNLWVCSLASGKSSQI